MTSLRLGPPPCLLYRYKHDFTTSRPRELLSSFGGGNVSGEHVSVMIFEHLSYNHLVRLPRIQKGFYGNPWPNPPSPEALHLAGIPLTHSRSFSGRDFPFLEPQYRPNLSIKDSLARFSLKAPQFAMFEERSSRPFIGVIWFVIRRLLGLLTRQFHAQPSERKTFAPSFNTEMPNLSLRPSSTVAICYLRDANVLFL